MKFISKIVTTAFKILFVFIWALLSLFLFTLGVVLFFGAFDEPGIFGFLLSLVVTGIGIAFMVGCIVTIWQDMLMPFGKRWKWFRDMCANYERKNINKRKDKALVMTKTMVRRLKSIDGNALYRAWFNLAQECGYFWHREYNTKKYNTGYKDLLKTRDAMPPAEFVPDAIRALTWCAAVHLIHAENIFLIITWSDTSLAHRAPVEVVSWKDSARSAIQFTEAALQQMIRTNIHMNERLLDGILERAKASESLSKDGAKSAGKNIEFEHNTYSSGYYLDGSTCSLLCNKFNGREVMEWLSTLDGHEYLTDQLK